MALEFDDRGLLPAGVHEATLEEIEEHFARFQRSDRRIKLTAKLRAYLAEVTKSIPGCVAVVDGSFVMVTIDEPDDIDLVLGLPADWDQQAALSPRQYNLVSRRRSKKDFEIDVFAFPVGSDEFNRWVGYFTQVNVKWCEGFGWPAGLTKGFSAGDIMSQNYETLAVLRKQLATAEEVVIGLHQKLWGSNRDNYYLYADGAIEAVLKLRAEIDEFLGIDNWKPDGSAPVNGISAQHITQEPAKS